MRKNVIYIILILFAFSFAKAQEKFISKIAPDQVKIQFAGNTGFFSTGIGYSFLSDKIQSDLFYGFTPECFSGIDIHTFSNKNTFRIYMQPLTNKMSLTFSAGFSINYTKLKTTFILLPEYYPSNYYNTNAIHIAPFLSSGFIYKKKENKVFKNLNMYIELSTLDNYFWYYIKTRAINYAEIWSLAFGINFPLKK